jgi:ABC-type transport system involved in multi-copper enzyme maturation permease subunit
MKTIIKYDFGYFKKTSKFLIIAVISVFLSGLSALTAKYFNVIIEYALIQEGIEIALPPVTVLESYNQFYSNFNQVYLFMMIFIAIAFFTFDQTRGHYPILFSKPLKKAHYILSKSILITGFSFISLLVSGLVFGYYTYLLFGSFDTLNFMITLGLLFLYVCFITHIALLLSVIFNHYLLPLIITIVLYFSFSILIFIKWGVLKYLPVQIPNYQINIMQEDIKIIDVALTSLVSVGLILLFLYVSIKLFEKKPLI